MLKKRSLLVNKYWEKGILDTETNVQFGEGGAGTFSDGKLTTRISDERCDAILEEFVNSGAPREIMVKAKPHIGTDILKNVVINLRKRIEAYGGEFRFNAKVTSIDLYNETVTGLTINYTEEIETNVVVFAIGHSARDTFEMLYSKGLKFIQKPFSIGLRIEHPQSEIDHAQFGDYAGHPKLGASDYQLFNKINSRTAISVLYVPGRGSSCCCIRKK